ncbi:PEP-CTERM sorting domain-containing protein [Pararoseomonas sp. SCSIO 73927]|uniref:PEP-CTERM sorting domain-containing protein n=1 Tax=Pararoseomonas sp. SCSIO 73927 TaxID=3114537 RepID=UPI0030D465F8
MKASLLALGVCGALLVGANSVARAAPIAVAGTEGLSVIVTSTDPVIATYEGTSADYTSQLHLVTNNSGVIFNNQTSPLGSSFNLGSFAIGTELVFRLATLTTGEDFYSGSGSSNPDGSAHARVQADYAPGRTLVSFEDLLYGAYNFNDLSFTLTSTTAMPAVGSAESRYTGQAGLATYFGGAASLRLNSGPVLAVPEPAAAALFGIGLLGLLVLGWRRAA